VDDFVQKLERVEPPNQLIAAIKDPLLQKYLQLRSSEEHVKRIDMWLLAFFEDRLSESNDDSSQTLSMLDAMLQYTRFTKVCRLFDI
jgi:centromere protein I